jgi:hypothetical protein
VTCVHVGVLPPTHNWAKILENCQAKKRPRLIQNLFLGIFVSNFRYCVSSVG